jgi:hypothetical protein
VDNRGESDAVKAFAWNMSAPGLKVAFAKSTNGSLAIRLKAMWQHDTSFCVDIPGGQLFCSGRGRTCSGARRGWGLEPFASRKGT